jgi:hypothetical protein
MLSHDTVIKLASILQLEDGAFIVGGQALNIWAERYAASNDRLAAYGPFTSKDLDYFGYKEAAMKLASELGGTLRLPKAGDHSPSVAVVEAQIGEDWVEVDFINNVIGVDSGPLERWATELLIPSRINGAQATLALPVMHPLHCLQSRIANVHTLGRQTPLALDQMHAAPHILQSYIDDMLELGDHREASKTLNALFKYLVGAIDGRNALKLLGDDLLSVFERFANDDRFDARYRLFNLNSIIIRLRFRRALAG